MDRRTFADPQASHELKKHCGSHDGIIHNFARAPMFDDFLGLLVKLHECVANESSDRDVVIAFFCMSGRHRSVAASLVAAHLAEVTVELPAPVQTFHACARYWYRLCSAFDTCARCHAQNETRDKALSRARSAWSRVLEQW